MFRIPKNKGLPCSLFEKILNLNDECPFHNHMDIYVAELGSGIAVIETPISENHLNPHKIAHGGVAFSMADTAMGMAIRTLDYFGVSIEVNINYLKPVYQSDYLRAVGKVINLGSRIIVAQAEIFNKKEEIIAVARGTFYNKGKFQED